MGQGVIVPERKPTVLYCGEDETNMATEKEMTAYHKHVERLAEKILADAIKEGQKDPDSAYSYVDEAVAEEASGDKYVDDVALSVIGLSTSHGPDSIFELGISSDISEWKSYNQAVTDMMFWALQTDLWRELNQELRYEERLDELFAEDED